MLRSLGLDVHASRISDAVLAVLAESKVLTHDLGGQATATDFTQAVIAKMK